MRLATLATASGPRVHVRTASGLLDVAAIAARGRASPWAGASLRGLLGGGEGARDFLEEIVAAGPSIEDDLVAEKDAVFLAPVPDPPRIFCLGRNYAEHAREGGGDVGEWPMIFLKPATSLAGHRERIQMPASTSRVDWEGELAIVIGRGGRNITEAEAVSHVAGLTAADDVTARDWQRRSTQFDQGKMFDGFGPIGPDLVTADEADPLAPRRIVTRLNGRTVQDGTTADMVFDVSYIVAYLSRAVLLLPGDIILTGTPAGVGYARTPAVFIAPGDEVDVEIEGVGTLTNTFQRGL